MSVKKSTALLVMVISLALLLETGCGTRYNRATTPTMSRPYSIPVVEAALLGTQLTHVLPCKMVIDLTSQEVPPLISQVL